MLACFDSLDVCTQVSQIVMSNKKVLQTKSSIVLSFSSQKDGSFFFGGGGGLFFFKLL